MLIGLTNRKKSRAPWRLQVHLLYVQNELYLRYPYSLGWDEFFFTILYNFSYIETRIHTTIIFLYVVGV